MNDDHGDVGVRGGLCVGRGLNEGVRIGDDIEVYLRMVDEDQGRFHLQVRAPKHLGIKRVDSYGRVQTKSGKPGNS